MARMFSSSRRQGPHDLTLWYRARTVRTILAVMRLILLGSFYVLHSAASAEAQDAAVTFDPSDCIVPEPYSVQTPPSANATPAPASDPNYWDSTEGDPIEVDLADELTGYVYAFLACSNAGNPEGALAFVTADYLQRHFSPVNAQATPSDARPTPQEEPELSFTVLNSFRAHGSDYATVFMTLQDPTYCVDDVVIAFVLRQVNGVWFIDDHAQVIDYLPVPWDPPVLRRGVEQVCSGPETTFVATF